MSKYGVFSGPYFPVFGLGMEIYGVNLRIQSKCRKIQIRKNSIFGLFLHIVSENYYFYKCVIKSIQEDLSGFLKQVGSF